MPSIDEYFDEIDASRIRRLKELSALKQAFSVNAGTEHLVPHSRAAVVLAYASWEGFYNDCVQAYVEFLKENGRKIRETEWMLLVGAFSPAFESLRARNHSANARSQFIKEMKTFLECKFDQFDRSTIEARSNLDYEQLAQNFAILNFDLSVVQQFRNRLDKEVVGWRHLVAHGDAPDLTSLDIADHVKFTTNLMIEIADCFQYAMLQRV